VAGGVEKLMAVDLKIILGLLHHGCNHFTHGGIQELIRKIDDFWWDTGTQEEIGAFIGEIVAVMLEDIVSRGGETGTHLPQELHEKLFRYLCESEVNHLVWAAY
jgi:hypothetical protein